MEEILAADSAASRTAAARYTAAAAVADSDSAADSEEYHNYAIAKNNRYQGDIFS